MKKFLLLDFLIIGFAFTFQYFNAKIIFRNEEGTEAYNAMQFLGTMNAFPNADIPDSAFGKAYNFFKLNYTSAASKVATSNGWRSIGPNNVGGRTISIAIDPIDTNVIWLGAASGGLWKSTVGGIGTNAWQNIATGFPVLGVAAIAINPQNHNEIYIGTGETYNYGTSVNGLVERTTRGSNGIGILKSIDGGVTWTYTLNWLYHQQRGVWDIVINPLNPQSVIAATTEGIYKSDDGGSSWNQVLSNTMVMDLEMDPNDTSIVYAGVGNLNSLNKGLYKTTDGGNTWNLLTNGLPLNIQTGRISITTYKSNSNIVMVHICDNFNTVGLYRSTNKGASFTAVSTGTNIAGVQGWYANGIMMKSNDSSQVFIAGQLLWASFTSGTNPYQYTNYNPNDLQNTPWPDIHGITSNPLDVEKIYLLTDAGLYRSNDFGTNWYACIDGYVVSQFYIGDVSASDSTIAIGGLQDRNTQKYTGTTSWNAYFNGDGTFTAIDKTDDQIQYASSQYLNINQSTDGGNNFNNSIFSGTAAAFVAPYVLAPTDQNIMYAGDVNLNQIDISTANSIPFSTPTGEPLLSIAVSNSNSQKLYFTTSPSAINIAGVFKSTDGGANITDITQGLPNRYPRDIEVNPLNDDEAVVVFSGFGIGHVFKTIDGGANWADISTTLPNIPFHSVLVNPNDTSIIYAGSDLGVFCSFDGGADWQTLNTGLPEAVMVFDLKYSPADNNLVAFTHGHGVYKIDLSTIFSGIQNTAYSTQVSVFPLPANNFINVELNASKNIQTQIIIYDVKGNVCLKKPINIKVGKNQCRYDIASLEKGVYFITTVEHLFTKKWVKME